MSGWKIIRIPTVSILNDECFEPYSSLRNVLYIAKNFVKDNSRIEITFLHENQGKISIYRFTHFTEAFDGRRIISQQITTAVKPQSIWYASPGPVV